jgi:phage/plasmid-associated DNA primase
LKQGNGLRKLLAPAKVLEYTSDYRNDNDGIAKFIADKLIPVADGELIIPVDKTTLKRVFKIWMSDNDVRLSPTDMEKRVELQFGKYHKGGWTRFKLDN